MPSPTLDPVVLSDEERSVMSGWARRRKDRAGVGVESTDCVAVRRGRVDRSGRRGGGTSRNTVSKWRSRFVAERLEGLSDEPRPGRLRVIGDEQIERVIAKTLEETPGRDTHWSTRSMASATGMS